MRTLALSAAFAFAFTSHALAWGQQGHSIVAEIAQRRLSPDAARMVEQLLGRGHSLASVASWADDVRDARPKTCNRHFVDIPLAVPKYDLERDCKDDPKSGFCTVAELDRLRDDLRCATGNDQIEALKFAVHFIGDIHQPLHTVLEAKGGNDIKVDIFMRGLTCGGTCEPDHIATNFHAAWDFGLIEKVVWDWGAYVDRLEDGWLKSAEATRPGTDGGTFVDWAQETHSFAPTVWIIRPANDVLDDRYLRDVLPILDRQLGVAGLRLAKFLNDAYGSRVCPAQYRSGQNASVEHKGERRGSTRIFGDTVSDSHQQAADVAERGGDRGILRVACGRSGGGRRQASRLQDDAGESRGRHHVADQHRDSC